MNNETASAASLRWPSAMALAAACLSAACGGGGGADPLVQPLPPPVQGVVFAVNTTDDRIDDDASDGVCHTSVNTCSLRAAIMQANHLSGPGLTTITVPAGTYLLTRPRAGTFGEDNGDLNLTEPLAANQTISIVGAGAASTVIDANRIDGVIRVAVNRAANLSRVTIRNGYRPGDGYPYGAGILNFGQLGVTDCVIEGNESLGSGGGIYNEGGLTIDRSTIRSNTAPLGGGLYAERPTTVRNSTFYGNAANMGGGIYNDSTLYVVNSTLSANTADTNGGGLYSARGATINIAALYNTTVVDNDADHDRDMQGGIGGGVYAAPGGRFIVVNTLIARNTILNSPFYDDCRGGLETYGVNLFGETSGCTFSSAAAWGTVSLSTIGPLQDNGGPNWSRALLSGSEAINATTAQGCVDETGALLTTDQRGAPRVAGARCDVGAFEFGAVVPQ